ncbi:MAG: DUF4192 domain-containing protein [Nocardioidaceae bacterium]|nr:DUF4192 domain-containing protein [Nocardioidaceae bacterium]
MGSRSRRSAARRRTSPVIRASSIAEMLGALPVIFGFYPQESLVVVVLEGPRQRVAASLRLDLPPVEHHDGVACQIADALRHQGAAAVLVVACTGDAALADPLVDACVDRLVMDGVDVVEAVRSDGNRYWSYRCRNPVCCPAEGTPYDPGASSVLAQAVAEGIEVLPDRSALAARLAAVRGVTREIMAAETSAAETEQVAIAGRASVDERLRVLAQVGAGRVKSLLSRAVAAPGTSLSDAEVASLSVWCRNIIVRDVAWAQISRDNAAASFAVWAQVARRVVPPFEPAVLCLASFAAWLKGDGASAWCALERVEAVEPGYSMMQLVRELLERGISPVGWPQLDEAEVWAALPAPRPSEQRRR